MVATTLSLVVIFAPIAFMSGQVGRFFNSFGFVVAFAILMSMAVSFTLTPMLCARFLKPPAGPRGSHEPAAPGWLTRRYVGILGWSLRHRWVIVVATLVTFLSTPVLFGIVGTDFVPKDDQSEFEVAVTLKEGATLKSAEAQVAELEGRLKQVRGVTNVFTVIGPTDGRAPKGQGDVTQVNIYCRMTDLAARDFGQRDAMADARVMLADYPDLRAAVDAPLSADQVERLNRKLERANNVTQSSTLTLINREGIDLHVRETGVQVVLEVRNRQHAQAVVAAAEAHGHEITELGASRWTDGTG